IARFAAAETESTPHGVVDQIAGERQRLLKQFAGRGHEGPLPIVVTSIQSLMQPVPSRDDLAAGTRTLKVGDTLGLDEISDWLVARGCHATSAVELPGEFARRGGLLDIFAPDWLA